MNTIALIHKKIFVGGILVFLILTSSNLYGHGGKTHGENEFTALNALQKATKLFDKLIDSKKLGADWETDLKHVNVSVRHKEGKEEHVVSFSRKDGSPETVYFFFNKEGKYAGSNFSGE